MLSDAREDFSSRGVGQCVENQALLVLASELHVDSRLSLAGRWLQVEKGFSMRLDIKSAAVGSYVFVIVVVRIGVDAPQSSALVPDR